eukprot:m.169827 g.169827  ORF g.169827 m.169827 type:complete len:106 (-) comp14511_c0_seq1:755-1072(-)
MTLLTVVRTHSNMTNKGATSSFVTAVCLCKAQPNVSCARCTKDMSCDSGFVAQADCARWTAGLKRDEVTTNQNIIAVVQSYLSADHEQELGCASHKRTYLFWNTQ